MKNSGLPATWLTPVLLLLSPWLFAQQDSAPPGVNVTQAVVKSFPLSAEALGNARANESVDIRPKITATLTEILFEEGQGVEAGAVLVKLDNLEQVADLAAAQAALVDSEASFRRSNELFKTNVVAKSQLLQDEARKVADEAMVSVAQKRLADTVVRAPFAGRIGLRRVSVGSLVDPDTVITTLDDTHVIKVDFDLPEIYLSRLQPGLKVLAHSAAFPDHTFAGMVSSVDTRVDPVSRTVRVRSEMPNPDGHLRPGMFLTVKLLNDTIEALVIPERALIPERSVQYVYVVDDNEIVEKRVVHIGRRRPGEVEIISGLSPGEIVIVDGTQKAREGQPVEILEREETTP
ncbi:MAG: efflux RND transporter periplasmic adaptor subunit [Lysobacterales bacterium]